MMDRNDHSGSEDTNGDGEGVWSADIEQCFREALLLFPPCGRRKHILQEEGGGKMYGRNELIARHIMMRTGKSRTRKQVSSHIQVLARRKAKAEAATNSSPQPNVSRAARLSGQSDAETISRAAYADIWFDRPIVTQKIRLVEFSAFHEYRNSPTACPPQRQSIGAGQADSSVDRLTSLSGLLVPAEDLNQQQQTYLQEQTQAVASATPTITTAHPLASNHQLSAQFNQATYQANTPTSNNSQLQLNQKAHSIQNSSASQQLNLTLNATMSGFNRQPIVQATNNQSSASAGGSMRHFYIRLDHSRPSAATSATGVGAGQQANKLERVDISRVQDKFPELSGSEGLYQRGPSDAFFLVKFQVDLSCDYNNEYNIDDQNSFFGFSSRFETSEPLSDITCSTKVCSYGLQVVEKVEKIYGAFNNSNGRYSFNVNRSPMCEFMIQFIKKLSQLPRSTTMLNSVLENFTVLQVVTNESTSEILLCLAYTFEMPASGDDRERAGDKVATGEPLNQVYKLTKD